MSINKEEHEGHYDDTKIVGKGTDGAMLMTLCAILGIVLIVGGILLGVYMNTRMQFGFAFGIPVVLIGIIVPLLLLWGVARRKVEDPND